MRVLVVEDDVALQRLLSRSFTMRGHEVTSAMDGEAASEHLVTATYDLVLLDLSLPKRDGMEVLRTMRQRDERTPVLVVSGREGMEERLQCFALGADDFLSKPFSLQELLARANALHRRNAAKATSLLVSGNLVLNRLSRSARIENRSVELTGKEFCLLEYLMQQGGRCVSRQELLDEVWKTNGSMGTNVVDVYINYLRRKLKGLETPGAVESIETVRGKGYRISAQAAQSPTEDAVLPALSSNEAVAA